MRYSRVLISATTGLLVVCGLPQVACGQSPTSINGTAVGLAVATGNAPFANFGYYFLILGNSGNSYQIANIIGATNSGGTYNYNATAASGDISLSDSKSGQLDVSLGFDDVNYGGYTATSATTGSQQTGDFIVFAGQCPSSVSGKTFSCTINDGAAPFAASGIATIVFAPSGNNYTIRGDGMAVADSAGTYTYIKVNTATAKVIMNDSVLGANLAIIVFADKQSGSFGIRGNVPPGFEIGDFQIIDTTPPSVALSYPANGQNVSNEVVTVAGRSKDNFGVGDVLYSINGGDWLEANTTNAWNNWNAQIVSVPGTNVLMACSIDNSGNISSTNTVFYNYIVSAPLTLRTVGSGKITPNLNNSLLQVGNNYKLTATGTAGFAFTNWTDGSGNIATNSPTMIFTMAYGSAYTANFIDVAKPMVSIQSASKTIRTSNSIFSIVGRATDNVSVSSVYYSVNNSGWNGAVTSNGWTNWSATITLVPGNNQLQTYAVDSSGNVSPTNSVTVFYVLSAPLAVQVYGRGTVRPNLSNAILPIGANYSMTAVPATGFAFNNWTDGNRNYVTNKPTLIFLMASNLSFTANFIDTARPRLNISTRSKIPATTNEFVTIAGTASDNVAVAGVLFQLNNNGWNYDGNFNQGTNWSTVVDLTPGTNMFSAYAIDTSGNVSATNNLLVVYYTANSTMTGLKADLTPDTGYPFSLSFSSSHFGLQSFAPGGINCVGSYSYTRLSPNLGRLRFAYAAPPSTTNAGVQDFNLFFTASMIARYTNNITGSSGTITFTPALNLAISSITNQTVIKIGTNGLGTATVYTGGRFVSTDLATRLVNRGAAYKYSVYSPLTAVLKQSDNNGTSYIIASFSATNYGATYVENYSPSGNYQNSGAGFFGLASQSASGNAPTALTGLGFDVISGNSDFRLAFSDNTFSQQSYGADFENGAGNYVYSPVDTNTSNLALNYSAPPDLGGASSSIAFSFFAPNLAYFVNTDNTVGAAVLNGSTNFAMISAMPPTLFLTNAVNADTDQFQFANDGTFSVTGDWPATGSYSFSAYSPEADIVQLTFDNGTYAGNSGWLQLNYTYPAGGSYQISFFDSANNLISSETGSFGQP